MKWLTNILERSMTAERKPRLNGGTHEEESGEKLPDPATLWGLVFRLATRVIDRDGVLVATMVGIVAALLYGNYRLEMQHRQDAQTAHQEFQAVLKDMVHEQKSANEELVKIGTALDRHLQHEERRGR